MVHVATGTTDKNVMPHRGRERRVIPGDQSVNLQILDVVSLAETRNRKRKSGRGVIHRSVSQHQLHFQDEIVAVAPAQLTDRHPTANESEKPPSATITIHIAEKPDRTVMLCLGTLIRTKRPEIRIVEGMTHQDSKNDFRSPIYVRLARAVDRKIGIPKLTCIDLYRLQL